MCKFKKKKINRQTKQNKKKFVSCSIQKMKFSLQNDEKK